MSLFFWIPYWQKVIQHDASRVIQGVPFHHVIWTMIILRSLVSIAFQSHMNKITEYI